VSVPVEDTALPQGDLGPVLPEGVADTNITGIPSAELTVTDPEHGYVTENGRVKVVGTSDAESVTISFRWRGNVDAEKTGPAAREVPVKNGVFRDSFQLPKGKWILYAAASIDGGYPAVQELNLRSLNDKMAVRVEAIDGKTRVKLTKPDGQIIAEKILLQDGQKKVFRVDPDVILRVGNAKAANVTVDGKSYGVMGDKALPVEWRLVQGKKPKTLD